MNLPAPRLLLCLLTLCALPSLCAAQTPSSAPAVWKPDPKLLAQLGPEVSVGDCKVRPPKGYIPVLHQQGTLKDFGWKGAAHDNGISPAFHITAIPIPQGEAAPTLERIVQSTQRSQKNYEPDATFTKPEMGTINGVSFVRFHWKGHRAMDDPSKTGPAAQGIVYGGVAGSTVFFIGIQDSDPEGKATLPLMEAAALTFRKG